MKTGDKKFTATSCNFNSLQSFRNIIKDMFCVSAVRWGGFWNGMNWENFSFYCTPETLKYIESFCKKNDFSIEFSK